MSPRSPFLSSVTRWLLVVVGCAVLETAQPMKAADTPPSVSSSATLAVDEGARVIYPSGARPSPAASAPVSPGLGVGWAFVAFVGLGAGALWWWRRRHPVAALRRRGAIVIEDTRPLGNRQFLVVASCDGRRFLLGVAQGGIRLISPLEAEPLEDDDDAPAIR